MTYDIKILEGLAILTEDWQRYRGALYEYACRNGGDRWKREDFTSHMYREFIKDRRPITLRLYSLDVSNLQVLLRFIDEVVMSGTASIEVSF